MNNVSQEDTRAPLVCFEYWYLPINKMGASGLFLFIVHVPVYSFFILLGLIGNSLAFIVLGKERPFTSTSLLLRYLAAADLLHLISQFLAATYTEIVFAFDGCPKCREFWEMSFVYTKMLIWATKLFSIYVTVCIGAERFIAVCKPLQAASFCTKRNAHIMCLSVGLFSFLFRTPMFFDAKVVWVYDPCSNSHRPVYTYLSTFGLAQFYIFEVIYNGVLNIVFPAAIPLTSLIFFTYHLLKALKESEAINESRGGKVGQNIRAGTIRVTSVIIIFLILETPNYIREVIDVFVFSGILNQIEAAVQIYCYGIITFLGVINSVVNFYVYCITGTRFRRTLKQVLTGSS